MIKCTKVILIVKLILMIKVINMMKVIRIKGINIKYQNDQEKLLKIN